MRISDWSSDVCSSDLEKRSTSIDIAKLAQVSPKSVSRVFNNEPHISPALRKKVLRAATELNYHPNDLAQGLVRRQSYLIGLIYEKPSPSYVVELQRVALEKSEERRGGKEGVSES